MRGEEAILGDNARIQRQLGNPVRDDVEISRVLRVFGKELEEAGVVDTVIIVVPGVHVERRLGHRPAAHVEDVREPFADRGV